jgi:hypothetical protein
MDLPDFAPKQTDAPFSIVESPPSDRGRKAEEHIGCPFVSRFSYSTTVILDTHHELAGEQFPRMLSEAARLFPGLLATQRDRPIVPESFGYALTLHG